MASRLQDVIARGLASAKPLATAVAPGTLYYSSDTASLERSNGTVWESYTAASSGGIPGAHAVNHQLGGSDPVALDQSQITGLAASLAAKADAVHAPTHALGGSDALSVLALTGYPGGTADFLRADGSFAPPPTTTIPSRVAAIGMVIDGGASVITTGLKGYLEVPFACTIQAVTLLADVVGSIVIDIWKDTYVNYPPVVGDTIVAAAKPTISGAIKSQDLTLTGWNTAIVAGDILGFNVDSVATIKKVTLSLKVLVP